MSSVCVCDCVCIEISVRDMLVSFFNQGWRRRQEGVRMGWWWILSNRVALCLVCKNTQKHTHRVSIFCVRIPQHCWHPAGRNWFIVCVCVYIHSYTHECDPATKAHPQIYFCLVWWAKAAIKWFFIATACFKFSLQNFSTFVPRFLMAFFEYKSYYITNFLEYCLASCPDISRK